MYMSALSQFLACCFKKITLFQLSQVAWHYSQHVHNIQTSLEILPDKLIHSYFLTTDDSLVRTRTLGLFVTSTLHKVHSTCQFNNVWCVNFINWIKPDNTALLYKRIGLFPNFPLLAKLLWLLFPQASCLAPIPTSIFCLFIRNLLYQLEIYSKIFFHWERSCLFM